MKEELINYVWRFKRFDITNLYTVQGEKLTLIDSGQYLQKSGPDFFNAKIIIGNQKWAGNIEIHSKSSDWYLHHHEIDKAYENVILHVVWEHDVEVFRHDNSEISVLELKKYVSDSLIENYQSLMEVKTWVYCEKDLVNINKFVLKKWQEQLFFERLERKSLIVEQWTEETTNDWEAILFYSLAKSFGLNANGESFLKMAKSIPFSIIKKVTEVESIEALFFGRLGLLNTEKEDTYFNDLKKRWKFLSNKYRLLEEYIDPVQFFQHRPSNFPTIRLSQLAQLYYQHKNLFSKVIQLYSLQEIYTLFDVSVSDYWQIHYQFDKESGRRKKNLTTSFVDLIVINTIVPLQFAYARSQGKDATDILINLLNQVPVEQNVIIDKFKRYGIAVENAFDTQSLLQLKSEYCNKGRCLQCAIGVFLLK